MQIVNKEIKNSTLDNKKIIQNHILVIPSEEFIPENSPLSGIFQYHQVSILKKAGYKVGVISISLSFTIPMILKALLLKLINKKVNNKADDYSFTSLVLVGYNKLLNPSKYIISDNCEGIPVIKIDGFYFHPPIENKNDYGWIKAGLTAFKRYIEIYGKPDIIHAHNAIYAGMLAYKIKEKYKINYIITEHSTVYERGVIKEKSILNKVSNAYKNSNGLYAVSLPFCNFLNKMFSIVKFKKLPNVLDPFLENMEYTSKKSSAHPFTFLNIAELHPKKDHFTLLHAFKSVLKIHPDIQLIIGGDGELSEELHELVSKEDIGHAVHFAGLLSRPEVLKYIQNADCFVLSSKYETFGVVLIEAMLFGKPVIATKCGGPEDIVTDISGILVETENELSLRNAMIDMIKNHSTYQNEEIRNFTINNFGKTIFLNRIKRAFAHANL